MSSVTIVGAAPPPLSSSCGTDASLLLDDACASLYTIALAYYFIGLYAVTDPTLLYYYQRGYKMSCWEVLPPDAFIPILGKGTSCALLIDNLFPFTSLFRIR